jgi:hypothetical protein
VSFRAQSSSDLCLQLEACVVGCDRDLHTVTVATVRAVASADI